MSRENSFEFLHLVHVVKEPNTFKHSDNVRDHLKTVQHYYDQTKCPDNLKLQLFLKYLSLGVLEDLKLQLDYHDRVDLEWYEDKMLELYDDRRSLVTILVELVDMKQTCSETTMDFATRIKEKVENKRIPINMQENIKVQLFINGLSKKNYSMALQILHPKTLVEAVNMLRLDFNILERNEKIEETSTDKSNEYLRIIKSLCDKINPAPQINRTNATLKEPDQYNLQAVSDDYKSLLVDIVHKLQNPNGNGIIIFPKSKDEFKILDVPKDDMIVGIPFENRSYEIVSCKKDSGYFISDSLTKKHTVYKLPPEDTLVLSSNGKIRFIKSPTVIGHSKLDKTMEIMSLPSHVVDDNNNTLTCDEMLSILVTNSKMLSHHRNSKDSLFEDPIQIHSQASVTISDEKINKSDQMESQNNSTKSSIHSVEVISPLGYHATNDFYRLDSLQSPQPISLGHLTFLDPVPSLVPCDDAPNQNQLSHSVFDDTQRLETLKNADFNCNSINQITNNLSKEPSTEKTIGRFKIITTPNN